MKVTIENLNNRLRLRWVCPKTGKRKTLAVGVEESTTGRSKEIALKERIESDINSGYGYYDSTLAKYLPLKKRECLTEITTVELFENFTKHQAKQKGLSKASIDTRYKYLKEMLTKRLDIRAADVDKRRVEAFVTNCWDTLKPDTAKQRIWLLKSCWDWGQERFQLPPVNPWLGVAEGFKSVPVQPVPAFSENVRS